MEFGDYNAIDHGVGKDEEPAFASIFGGNSKHWIVSGSRLSVHTNKSDLNANVNRCEAVTTNLFFASVNTVLFLQKIKMSNF